MRRTICAASNVTLTMHIKQCQYWYSYNALQQCHRPHPLPGQSCGGELRGGGHVGELWPQRVGHHAPDYAVLPNLRLQPSNINLDYDPV